MSTDHKWVKFRTRHSAGPGQWQYREMPLWRDDTPLEKQLDSFMRELNDELSTQSEHWRGIEADFEDPPRDVLVKEIEYARDALADAKDRLARLEEQLMVTP